MIPPMLISGKFGDSSKRLSLQLITHTCFKLNLGQHVGHLAAAAGWSGPTPDVGKREAGGCNPRCAVDGAYVCDCVGAAGGSIVCAFAVWKPVEGCNFYRVLGWERRSVWWHVVLGHQLGMACEEMRTVLHKRQGGVE